MTVDGRGVSVDVHSCDTIGVSVETALKEWWNTPEGLTETPMREVATAVNQRTNDDRRRIAGEYLTRARDDFERAARTRLNYIFNARRYGMTYGEIGTLLGVTEAAVRSMLKRHGGDN